MSHDYWSTPAAAREMESIGYQDGQRAGHQRGLNEGFRKGMNQGIWKDLEELVRVWAIDREELFVFTGAIYEGGVSRTIGKNKVAVPSHLYKIVYDPNRQEAIAFIMPNKALKTEDMPNYIATIRDIEEKTGLDFFSNFEKELQDVIETKRASGLWQ